jgi:anti-sigma28 factor (negative regulator of flagellin synthesis)
MRISNGTIDSLGSGQVGSVGGTGTDSRSSALSNSKSDSVSLSSAASLVALAKNSAGASRQSKIDSISAQLKTGSYQAEPSEVSQAVVAGHITG